MVASDNPFRLDGRKALITGGGSGLGLAIAEALSGAGAGVVLLGRNGARLEQAASGLRERGAVAESISVDLLDAAAVDEAISATEEATGPIDILINNAGAQSRAPALSFGRAEWDSVLATNLTAPFFLAQRVARGMAERGAGKIVNTLSLLAELGRPTVPAYSAAKGGLRMLTRALAVEWAPKNIQVNGIAPGYFRTEMNTALTEDKAFSDWLVKRTPAGRWGEPADVGPAAVFLSASASDFITGQVIFVDGGISAAI